MARHYSREELLRLKESPLVARPSRLPPAEEWMGPPPDPSQSTGQQRGARTTNKGKAEDGTTSEGVGNRRPGFTELRRKSTTAPEDIILGPPKTAFASASRIPQKVSSGSKDDERLDKTRDGQRFTRDAQRPERKDATPKPRDAYSRGHRESSDPWSFARQTRTGEHTEHYDKLTKRREETGDKQDFDGRDSALDGQRNRNFKTNGERDNHDRRNGHWRSQDTPLWANESDSKDADLDTSRRNFTREVRDRRSGNQGRGWGQPSQVDDDPLWMDAAEPEAEKKNAPTQADFEEFRKKMKAQNNKTAPEPSHEPRQSIDDDVGSKLSAKPTKTKALDFGDFSDKFYDLLSQPKKQNSEQDKVNAEARREVEEAAIKMAKSSKFSSLFNTDSAAKNAALSQPQADTSSEDKAGFQRILKLLDQQQHPGPEQRTPAPNQAKQSVQSPPAVHSPPRQHEEMKAPRLSAPPSTRDGQFLLNLMLQSQQTQNHPQPPTNGLRREQELASGNMSFANLAMSPPQDHAQMPAPPPPPQNAMPRPSFYDEPPRHEFRHQDKLNPNGPPLHRGAPPGLPEMHAGLQRPPQLPPGLDRRQPAFEHMQGPPYGGQAPPPQPLQRPMPPPGFPAPPRPPPGQGMGQGIPPGMYGARQNGPGMPPPPPGFMNMNGPAPGISTFNSFGPEPPGYGGGGYDFPSPGYPGGQQRR